MSIFRKFLQLNQKLSFLFDRLLPESMRVYGTTDFHVRLLPTYLPTGGLAYDIGGGKRPHIFLPLKESKQLEVVGIDIDADELAAAPAGHYDRSFVADITQAEGAGDGDVIICRSTLEHVHDVPAAMRQLGTFLKSGGLIIIYAPCRNAIFAKLNLLLPENTKNKLLRFLYGQQADVMGFKAYYDHCTLSDLTKLATQNGYQVVESRSYWMSNYFSYLTPLHIIWRLYQLAVRPFCPDLAEGQALVLRK